MHRGFVLGLLLLFGADCIAVTIGIEGSSEFGDARKVTRRLLDEWARKTGNQIVYLSKPNSYPAAFGQFLIDWAAHTADIDVYSIDTTWQAAAAPHAIDLTKYFSPEELRAYFPQVIKNNTVDGKLVSVPTSVDVGLLYYRTDLLKKYGFADPPETWDELTKMARTIQVGERAAGDADFYGYLWQGKDEGVLVNALEWIFSYGGGTIIEPDGRVSINNPGAIDALNGAREWLGSISPTDTLTYAEEDCRNIFESGRSAFMRNWPYVYVLADKPDSRVRGKFSITVLPKGRDSGTHAGALGGWSLMVSKYSKHPDVAADLVKYFSSAEVEKAVALELSGMPSRPALYQDEDILSKYPWFAKLPAIFDQAVARPSDVLGAKYNRLAYLVSYQIDRFLRHDETAEETVHQIEDGAKKLMRDGE
ncbi:MAG: ABC transporter substrate-binding protein [Verrucomicrobia bacterium]|nr:ABC transporter substrate-binding protein [Verrucomicrobiota bacterium]